MKVGPGSKKGFWARLWVRVRKFWHVRTVKLFHVPFKNIFSSYECDNHLKRIQSSINISFNVEGGNY